MKGVCHKEIEIIKKYDVAVLELKFYCRDSKAELRCPKKELEKPVGKSK